MGFGVGEAFGHDTNTSLFLGAALAATSVGITARVFSDLRALATVEARTVLGAAVADDVLGLVILTVVVRIVTEGSVSIADVARHRRRRGRVPRRSPPALGGRFGPPLFQFLAALLPLGRHAGRAGARVHARVRRARRRREARADRRRVRRRALAAAAATSASASSASSRPVGHLFIPVFFLAIGIEVDVEAFVKPEVLGIAGGARSSSRSSASSSPRSARSARPATSGSSASA